MISATIYAAGGSEIFRDAFPDNGRIEIDRKILAASERRLTLSLQIPILDMHGYWKPDLYRPVMQLHWTIRLDSAANCNYPLLIFFNMAGINRLSVYSTNLCDDCRMEAKMNQQTGCYELTAVMSISEATEPFAFVLDGEPLPWSDMPGRVLQAADEEIPAFPTAAWDPVYCSWYAVHAALDMDYLERNTAKAAELGFGTFIVDDGWSFDESKRATPQTTPTWYRSIGDWRVSERKLPGFAAHVERAQARGLNYLLWAAPFFIGADQPGYSDSSEFLSGLPGNFGVFDPADPVRADRVIGQLGEVFSQYNLDGMKLDFLANVPPDPTQPHGRAAERFIARLTNELRKHNPKALIEFRHFYSTPRMLRYGTQFRANDTPFDFIENFHRIVQLRMMLGSKVPVHSDPACWRPDELPENIARHMIAAIAGVPMLSMELGELSETGEALIRYYLEIYKTHRPLFANGTWRFRYEFDRVAWLSVKDCKCCAAWVTDEESAKEIITGSPAELCLFNLGANPIMLPPGGTVFNYTGHRMTSDKVLPIAGMVKFRK